MGLWPESDLELKNKNHVSPTKIEKITLFLVLDEEILRSHKCMEGQKSAYLVHLNKI